MKNRSAKPNMSFRERIYRFMYGRNGTDAFCRDLLILYLCLIVINILIPRPISWFISILELPLAGYIVFRTLSRNIYKRQRENQWYLRQRSRVKGFLTLQRNKWRDRKTHVYRSCKHCKKTLRLPRVKGKHTVCCPCCHKRF